MRKESVLERGKSEFFERKRERERERERERVGREYKINRHLIMNERMSSVGNLINALRS